MVLLGALGIAPLFALLAKLKPNLLAKLKANPLATLLAKFKAKPLATPSVAPRVALSVTPLFALLVALLATPVANAAPDQSASNRFALHKGDLVVHQGTGGATILEFGDYSCIYCRKNHYEIKQLLAKHKQVQVIYRQFPILGKHSIYAAKAVIATQQQSEAKARQLHNALMELQVGLSQKRTITLASRLGVDTKRLTQAMADPNLEKLLLQNHSTAEQLGIRGTPAFVINGKVYGGYMSLKELEDAIAP